MTTPDIEDLAAAHEIVWADGDTWKCHGPGCTFTGSEAAAGQHARENGLCSQCHGTGESHDPYAPDGSGIGRCAPCGSTGTAAGEDEVDRTDAAMNAQLAKWEEDAQSALFEREPPEL